MFHFSMVHLGDRKAILMVLDESPSGSVPNSNLASSQRVGRQTYDADAIFRKENIHSNMYQLFWSETTILLWNTNYMDVKR